MDSLVAIEVLAFECWRLDRRVGRLFRRDTSGDWLPVQIGSRALAVLDVLLDRPGILVSKDAIMDAVWPHDVAPNNLTVRFTSYNLVLRLVALGYTQIYWYRGGWEAWQVAGQPDTPLALQSW
jgi:DNA-binding winged helix-turn-helix (wHTH) protein